MRQITILPKKNFDPKSYVFGFAPSNDVSSVTNWQQSNVFDFNSQDGFFYFFMRNKKTGLHSSFGKMITCGTQYCTIKQSNIYEKVTGNNSTLCSIRYTTAYKKASQNACVIGKIGIYQKVANPVASCILSFYPAYMREQIETDWTDGLSDGGCQIIYLTAFEKVGLVTQTETDWMDGISDGCNIKSINFYQK